MLKSVAMWLPPSALLTFAVAVVLVILAGVLGHRQRWRASMVALALSALLIRGYAAADRSLHPWDERYHALVAKNFIQTPLTPRLYHTPVLPYDHRDWTDNYIWMHKPPLALWLQAASMKMFGVHEFALRLPSILVSTAAVVVTCSIGTMLFNPAVGLLAGVFQTFNAFLVDLASGRRVSDHVDTLLIFLFELALLVSLKAARRNSIATGVFLGVGCGAAYLTKSLPALLILPVWAVMRFNTATWEVLLRELMTASVVAAAVAAPWSLYTASTFPLESSHEYGEALRRITQVLEDQGGPFWKYLADMPRYFGELVYLPIAIAIWSVFRDRRTHARRSLLLWVGIPYAAFSACATKAPGYVMTAAPALFLLQADVWFSLWHTRQASVHRATRVMLAAVLFLLAALPARSLLGPTGPLERRERNPVWARQLRQLNTQIGDRRAVIFNVRDNIEAMFYTPYVVYEFVPTASQVRELHADGYQVYMFDDGSAPLQALPPDVTVIRPE